MTATRIVIMAKAPIEGLAKTRLIPALGREGAAHLARLMLLHTLREARAAELGAVELCVTPGPDDPAWTSFPRVPGVTWSEQSPGDLGARLAQAASRAIEARERVLLIGTDCPALDAARLRRAAALLADTDAVLLPTLDGGYALLGLKRFHSDLFDGIPWSTPKVAAVTRERIGRLNWSLSVGGTLQDIDEPADIPSLPDNLNPFAGRDSQWKGRSAP